MIISIEEFANYNNLQFDTNEEPIIQNIINYGESVVTSFLRYDLVQKDYAIFIDGYCTYFLSLPFKPISNLTKIEIDGIEIDLTKLIIRENKIIHREKLPIFKDGLQNIYVECKGGFATIPPEIKGVTLEIASLIWSNKGQNIGVTSKADEFGNKTFINYSNFDKYLNRINHHRILF